MSGQSTTIKFEIMKLVRNAIRFSVLIFGAILYGHAISTLGANITVGTGDYFFSPSNITINIGDSVTWTGLPAGGHTTTSQTGLWDSSANNFSFTFTSSGRFGYYCIPHLQFGMVGAVTVNAAVVPVVTPTVSITNPVSGAVFSAPANVSVQASATISSGTVTNVQFLIGSTVLANKTAAPYVAVTNNLAAGTYKLSAIATGNDGSTATNSVTINVVAAAPLKTTAAAISSAGGFQFSYSATVGLTYVVQVSTNLSSGWTSLATNTATTSPVLFTAPASSPNGAFYRVEQLPNP
jgi:plastocyanin